MTKTLKRSERALLLIVPAILAFVGLNTTTFAQTTSTWNGGAGNWAPCPHDGGNALWDTCSHNVYPDGNFNAVIQGGPVTDAGGIEIVDLTVAAGDSLIITPGYLDITGSAIVNNGSISIGSGNGLAIDGPATATLSGNGTLTMATFDAGLRGFNAGAGFINQETIQGQGSMGIGTLAITNQGTIMSSGGRLDIQPSTFLTNTRVMEATSGSTLQFDAGFQSIPFNNTGGTVTALSGGTVNVNSGTWNGGTFSTVGTGIFNLIVPFLNGVTNTGKLTVPSTGTPTLEGTTVNNGTITLQDSTIFFSGNAILRGSGSMLMSGSSGSTLTSSASTDTLTNKQSIHGAGTIYALTVNNQGIIQADNTSTPLTLASASAGATPTNNTSILQAIGGGTLQINHTVNNSGGTIQALSGSTVLLEGSGTIRGGTLKTTGTGTIQSFGGATLDGTTHAVTNAGAITLSSSEELYLQGTIHNTGIITLNGSCLGLTAPTILTGTGRVTMNSNACFLAFSESNTLTNQSTIQGSGTIGDSNPMRIINNGTIIANQTSPLLIVPASTGFTNNGELLANAGSTLNITNFFTNLSSGALTGGTYQVAGKLQLPGDISTNAGDITLTGTSSQILDQFSANALAGFASNAAKGSFTLAGNQNLNTSRSLSNAGTIKISKGSTFTVGEGGSYTQTGGKTTVDGTLATSAAASFLGGSLFLIPAGSIKINGGSVFGNGGNLSANVTSSGTITPADASTTTGKLTVTGAYSQTSTGALDINIVAASQFNQLSVTGAAALGGMLNIKLLNGFVPGLNSTFKILSCSSRTGRFATVNGTSINGSEHFTVQYNSNNISLHVVTGP